MPRRTARSRRRWPAPISGFRPGCRPRRRSRRFPAGSEFKVRFRRHDRADAQIPWEPARSGQLAISTRDGHAIEPCRRCTLYWDALGRTLNLGSRILAEGKPVVFSIPLKPGEDFPPIPPGGFTSSAQMKALNATPLSGDVRSPVNNSVVEIRGSSHRNIYRIPLQ